MNIYSLPGTKVKPRISMVSPFDNTKIIHCGENSDIEHIVKHLDLNKTYSVKYTKIDSWSTIVYLEEYPNIFFNSVCFENVEPQTPEDDQKHPHYWNFHKKDDAETLKDEEIRIIDKVKMYGNYIEFSFKDGPPLIEGMDYHASSKIGYLYKAIEETDYYSDILSNGLKNYKLAWIKRGPNYEINRIFK
jgi:hypothetical protein